MLATDFANTSPNAVTSASLTLSAIRATFARAAPKAGIIILDACRDNPLAISADTSTKGLARSSTGPGLLIAYATDPGNVAFEGSGNTSVFTTALLKHIAEPGLDVRLMFGRVRQDVVLKSRGAQVPWVEESLIGDHTLNPSLDNGGREALVASDIAAWRKASSKSTPAPYRDYLAAFPDGMFSDFAQQRIARLSYTQTTKPTTQTTGLDVTKDPSRISAALSILGFAKRSLSPLDLDDLEIAANAYSASLGEDAAVSTDNLFADASRLLLYLGGNVGRQIQIDIAALASIDQTIVIADAAMAELLELAESDPNAQPYVEQAREDIAAIRQAQTEVLAALDQERAYYEDLMKQANTSFADYMVERTIGTAATRSAPSDDPKLATRAKLFLKHVQQEASPETRGSYKWLTDFLPKS